MITVKEHDFRLIQGKDKDVIFAFVNDDGTIYDLTGSSVELKLYKTDTPLILSGTVDATTGKITFSFLSSTYTNEIGNYEYIIEETKTDNSLVELLRGNVIIYSETDFSTSIRSFLLTELPATIKLDENYIQQRMLYWKLFLCSAAKVAESAIYNDSSWNIFYRMLIAKLIAYDALELAAKGSYFQFIGGNYTNTDGDNGAPVKKIVTGPSEVEFHDTLNSIEKIFKPNNSGQSAWDMFQINLCGLANKIGVKIPMCSSINMIFAPTFSKNPAWEIKTLNDLQEDNVISIG